MGRYLAGAHYLPEEQRLLNPTLDDHLQKAHAHVQAAQNIMYSEPSPRRSWLEILDCYRINRAQSALIKIIVGRINR